MWCDRHYSIARSAPPHQMYCGQEIWGITWRCPRTYKNLSRNKNVHNWEMRVAWSLFMLWFAVLSPIPFSLLIFHGHTWLWMIYNLDSSLCIDGFICCKLQWTHLSFVQRRNVDFIDKLQVKIGKEKRKDDLLLQLQIVWKNVLSLYDKYRRGGEGLNLKWDFWITLYVIHSPNKKKKLYVIHSIYNFCYAKDWTSSQLLVQNITCYSD